MSKLRLGIEQPSDLW